MRHEGNKELFLFAELSILGLLCGWPVHLHVEGLRGTGKTTILRAARSILPPLTRVKGCPYNCDPAQPQCPLHAGLSSEELAALGTETVPRPFLEISHAAKIGTVVGTLDLKRLTNVDQPEAAILPGTLPQAHRGIVFVDEINRLADTAPELTDILLDVMGTKPGRVQIEENGLPRVSVPVQVCVWAASNPDEDPGPLADIRRQLSDRFDFVVQMGRPQLANAVLDILSSSLPGPVTDGSRDRDQAELLVNLAARMHNIALGGEILTALADLYLRFHLESLRAVEALKVGALLHAARWGREAVTWEDVVAVAPAALRRRVRPEDLPAILAHLEEPISLERQQVAATVAARDGGRPRALAPARQRVTNQGTVRTAPSARTGWLQSAWDRWRQRFSYRTRNVGQSSVQSSANASGPAQEQGASGGAQALPNPLDLPLVAPPRPARPLRELEGPEAIVPAELEPEEK